MRDKRYRITEPITTKVTADMKRRLEEIARSERRTLAQVARFALEYFVELRNQAKAN